MLASLTPSNAGGGGAVPHTTFGATAADALTVEDPTDFGAVATDPQALVPPTPLDPPPAEDYAAELPAAPNSAGSVLVLP